MAYATEAPGTRARTDLTLPLVPEQVRRQARERPDQPAVVTGGTAATTLTYGDLDRRATGLAALLAGCGVGPDVRVAVYLPPGPDLAVALLGVMLAGGCYVPLDVEAPPARTEWLLADCRPVLVLTGGGWLPVPPGDRLPALDVGSVGPAGAVGAAGGGGGKPAHDLPVVGGRDLAYAVYTSGTTGTPKGVLVEHASLAAMVAWYRDTHGLGPGDRVSQLVRPSFDGFALEIWPCLAAGATLHVGDPAAGSAADLAGWICRSGITVCFAPTPLAVDLFGVDWPDPCPLRLMLTGGDRLAAPRPAGLPFTVTNNYGPAECTVVATWAEVPAVGGPPPLGRPIAGMRGHVLDRWLRPVAPGTPGELYLAGAGVARGYLGRPALTAQRFGPDPFAGRAGERMYATGDLVCQDEHGVLHFLGRTDDQVQVRGHRVEPAEVENALLRHPAVRAAAVVPRTGGEHGESQLVACVVVDGLPAPEAALREFCAGLLPRYMVPAATLVLDALPRTAHGKVDRAALARLAARPVRATEPGVPPEVPPGDTADRGSGEGAARGPAGSPGTSDHAHRAQRVLAAIWSEVLDVDGVAPDDNFFELGGDSLLVMRVVGRAKQDGVQVSADDMFEYQTLRELAAVARELDPAGPTGERR